MQLGGMGGASIECSFPLFTPSSSFELAYCALVVPFAQRATSCEATRDALCDFLFFVWDLYTCRRGGRGLSVDEFGTWCQKLCLCICVRVCVGALCSCFFLLSRLRNSFLDPPSVFPLDCVALYPPLSVVGPPPLSSPTPQIASQRSTRRKAASTVPSAVIVGEYSSLCPVSLRSPVHVNV